MKLFKASLIIFAASFAGNSVAATLNGSFSPIAEGTEIQLSTEGKLDWVHWGVENDTSLNRKATVTPQISDFSLLQSGFSFSAAYRYADNFNGYTWSDGTQIPGVTNTPTGVYVVGPFNPVETNGFQFTVPADTTLKTLKVFVGAFAARGRFQATLSDHPTSYINTNSVNNAGNGPGGFYEINFAANSPNQTLTIRWTVAAKFQADGNVTLQAATLSSNEANSPPFARITSPSMNANFAAPANITVEVEAFDPDGTISRVEIQRNGVSAGDDASGPFSLTMNDVPAGKYRLTAHPVDNASATSVSRPIAVFVHTTGGTLNGSVEFPPATVDLTAEGAADWAHWGLTNATSVNRKASGASQIGALTLIGTNLLQQQTDSFIGYTWNDGTPTAETTDTKTGVFVSGITNGFQFSVPADTNSRTLKIYVGLYGGSGNFQAWLSDFSAPAFTDRSLTNAWGTSYAVYTLDFAAASAGQTLQVKYTSDYLFDQDYGNVALQAATLAGAAPIAPVYLVSSQASSGNFTFSFQAESGRSYTVQYTDSLNPINWQTLTTITGTDAEETVTDTASHPQRFYRIQMN